METEYGELMTAVMLEIFPQGFPSDEQVKQMSHEEKSHLYVLQKQLIHRFREKADEEILILQQRIKELPPLQPESVQLTKNSKETKSTEVLPRQPLHEPPPKPCHTPRYKKRTQFNSSKLPSIETRKRIRPPVQQLPTPPPKLVRTQYTKPPFHR